MINSYNFTKNDILNSIKDKIPPFDVHRIISAYEIAESAHQNRYMADGSPYFYHIARVSEIIIKELALFDADLIICSLLFDIYSSSDNISREILEYNFGPLVALFIENFHDNTNLYSTNIELNIEDGNKIILPGDSFLIIHLADCLDNLRYLEIDPIENPVSKIIQRTEILISSSSQSENPSLKYLIDQIKIERNKIIG